MSEQNRNYGQIEEITLHFGKGTVEPFATKDGREMLKIVIPNADRSDHTPRTSFELPAKAVHENQFGTGLWTKFIPMGTQLSLSRFLSVKVKTAGISGMMRRQLSVIMN